MIRYVSGFSLLMLVSQSALALQAMDDAALSSIAGRDGLSIRMEGDMSAGAIQTHWDVGTPYAGTLSANDLTLTGVNADGTLLGAPDPVLEFTVDAGDGLLALGLNLLTRSRLRTDSLTIPDSPVSSRSFGTWAFDFDATLRLENRGIFSMANDSAYLFGEIGSGDLFYRQGSDANAWMAMHDFLLRWEIPSGTLGLCGYTTNYGCKGEAGIVHRAGDPWQVGDPQVRGAPSATDVINIALDFEYVFGKKEGSDEFKITPNARGVMHFGWLGSLKDVEVKWKPGGSSLGATANDPNYGDYFNAYATTTQGLRLSSQWDYITLSEAAALGDPEMEFRWRLGETADVGGADKSRVNFELGDWTIWGTRTAAKPSSHYFPMIAMDVIKGGQGPGGLCWGHALNLVNGTGGTMGCGSSGAPNTQFINVRPGYISNVYGASVANNGDASSLAIVVRDGQLQTYSRKVRLLSRDAAGVETTLKEFGWGLIYALANVDANIYLYPGGSGSAGAIDNGMIADIMVMSQTYDEDDPYQQGFNWDHGTHLMIADTDANMGIGFMSTSFVVAGNDTRIWVKNQNGNDYYSGGLDFFSPQARFNYRATFGGGLLPGHPDYLAANKPQTVRGTKIDMNLEGLVNLRFSPSDPNEANNRDGARNFLGYSGALRLGTNTSDPNCTGTDCGLGTNNGYGSYLSLAEPRRPDVDIRLANVTGDIAFTEGQIDLALAGEPVGPGGAIIDRPRLRLSNYVHIGTDAATRMNEAVSGATAALGGSAAGQPLIIDRVMLGQAELGSIVIPSARIYSSITLEPQTWP